MKKYLLAISMFLFLISCGKKENETASNTSNKEIKTPIYTHDDWGSYIKTVDTILLTKVAANLKIPLVGVNFEESSSIDYTDSIAFLIVSFKIENNEGLRNVKGGKVYFVQRKYVFANKTNGKILAEETDANLSHYDDEVMNFSKSYVFNKLIKLNDATQAIGFITEVKGDGKINLYARKTFTIVALINHKIKKILNDYPVFKTDGDPEGGGKFRLETEKADVSISNNKTKGFNDLIVSKTFSYEEKKNLQNGTKAKLKPVKTKKETEKILYNGTIYYFKIDNEFRFLVV